MGSEIPLLGDPVSSGLYRVVVHGNSATGKSTLAKKLAQTLQVPVIHLDEIHWKPNWVESSSEEMIEALNRIFEEADKSNTGWVLDGNYETKTKRLVDHIATDIIWLDPPFWRYFPRAVLRTLRRLLGLQEPCAEGCRESWRELLSSNSILLWVWTHHDVSRSRYGQRWTEESIANGGKWRRLGDIDEHERWLEEVKLLVRSQ